ncbi:hypothetical protein ACS0TY_009441 [Phlomoides rotata]
MGFVHVMAATLILDFRKAAFGASGGTSAFSTTDCTTWIPPSMDYIKVNSDASVIHGLDVGIGGVARDNQGIVLWCFAEKISGELDVDSAEATAALHAIRWAKEQKIRRLILESDSHTLFNALLHPKPNLSFFGLIVRDILSLVSFF